MTEHLFLQRVLQFGQGSIVVFHFLVLLGVQFQLVTNAYNLFRNSCFVDLVAYPKLVHMLTRLLIDDRLELSIRFPLLPQTVSYLWIRYSSHSDHRTLDTSYKRRTFTITRSLFIMSKTTQQIVLVIGSLIFQHLLRVFR